MFFLLIFLDYLKSMFIWGFFYSFLKVIYNNDVKVCLLDKLFYIFGLIDYIKVN